VAVLALSAASSADVATAWSFSISASVRANLDASESLSVAAATAAVWAAVARSSAGCRAASRDVYADTSPATAAAAPTRATTCCISSWARSAQSSRAAWARLRTDVVLIVYFGTPKMLITLWFGFVYGTNPPLGTLII
jgi:hypothetical protein